MRILRDPVKPDYFVIELPDPLQHQYLVQLQYSFHDSSCLVEGHSVFLSKARCENKNVEMKQLVANLNWN